MRKNYIKNLFLTITALAYLWLLLVGIPANQITPYVNKILSSNNLKLNKDVKLYIYLDFPLQPKLSIHDLNLTLKDKKSKVASASSIDIAPGVFGLITGSYSLNYVGINKAEFDLSKDVINSISPKQETSKDKNTITMPDFSFIRSLNLTNVNINYQHGNDKQEIHIEQGDMGTGILSHNLKLSGTLNKQKISVVASPTIKEESIDFSNIYIRYKNAKISGDFSFKLVKNVFISSNINISTINTADFSSDSDKKTNVVLPLSKLRNGDVDIKINIKEFIHNEAKLENLKIRSYIKDDALLTNIFLAENPQPIVTANNSLTKPYNAKFNTYIKDVPLNNLINSDLIKGGDINISLNTDSYGASSSELINNLNGNLLSEINGASITKSINYVGNNLLIAGLNAINPFKKNSNKEELECAVFNFKVKKGVLNGPKTVGIRTKSVDIIGSAKINLNNSKIDISISPKGRGIDLKLFNIASLVKITGTIGKPKISINPAGAIKEAAGIVSGVLTGGLSTLADTVASTISDEENSAKNPCNIVKND